jgi:hypothetical protein
MKVEMKSKYARIDLKHCIIRLYENEPDTISDIVLQDVDIEITNNSCIEIKGDQLLFWFALEKTYIKDLKKTPCKEIIKNGYKDFFDFILCRKRNYIDAGYYKLEETISRTIVMSQWVFVI